MSKNQADLSSSDSAELEPLRSSNSDKHTRFQVNRVKSYNSDENGTKEVAINVILADDEHLNNNTDDEEYELRSVTDRTRLNSENAKSFRHLTREALPRVDNYRNIISIQAANRPTLDDLHNATLPNKTSPLNLVNGQIASKPPQLKFGWIEGVLVRCLLNIWGVMLFLRLTWVVGQAGIGQSILLISTTTAVTSITSLSMSAISTNGVIKGGGTYYMISRSLGPEFGGSIGLIFSLANAVACAMYVVGFCESLKDLLKSVGLKDLVGPIHDVRIIGCLTLVLLTLVVVGGMKWESKAQIVLLVILLVAIADFFIGSFIGPKNDLAKAKGFLGYNASLAYDNFYPDYRPYENIDYDFFGVFSVFFPAATGILAGANISGDLKDPQSSIPKGTILSIALTSMSYILMSIVAGCTVLRDATGNVSDYVNGSWPYPSSYNGSFKFGLHHNFQVVELVSWVGPLIYAGCFAATLSSALASLVSAPKVFQALCKDKLYPKIEWFAKGYGQNNEPIRGYILTFVIAGGFILIGRLNSIAPLISNFFLAAYTLINFSTFHASLAKPVGWRPTFKFYNMWLSLLGSLLCVLVMFLISWFTALLTLAAVLALYLIVAYRKPDVNWGSTTQAQMYKNALQACYQLNAVEDHVKNYRPQILVLSGMPSARPSIVNFANLLTKNLSMLVCGHINTCPLLQRYRNVLNYKANSWLKVHKFKSFYMQVDGLSFADGCKALIKAYGIGKLRPNILMMGFKSDWQTCSREDLNQYFEVLHNALDLHMGVGILRLQPGLDCSGVNEEEKSNSKNLSYTSRNRSYSQMSQASTASDKSFPGNNTEQICVAPDPDDSTKKGKSITESAPDTTGFDETDIKLQIIQPEILFFEKKQGRGSIDVWWLYDDGGLTLLLPYILSTRRNWSSCKLRVFALANKRDELELEHRNMASLLAKFRIDYTDLKIVSDITAKAHENTQKYFENLISHFICEEKNADNNDNITESELLAVKDKTNRHLRLRELLQEHSMESNMVVVTLPIPRKNMISAPLYLAWLELLTKDMPPILLVRGNQTSVLTFYS